MGRSVPVKIGRKEFASKQKAWSFYMDNLPEVTAVGVISEGEYFEELKELFTLYSDSCPGRALNGHRIVHFTVQNEPQSINSSRVTYPGYRVQLGNGELRPFFVEKAITALAKAAAEQR